MTLLFAAEQISLPYQVNYEEGNVLNAAVRIVKGENPYPAPGGTLYVFNPYGPVAYYLAALLVRFFGVSFIYPRWLVTISGLLIAALLALLLRHWTGSWKLGLCFGFVYLTLPVVRDWVFLLRVDLVGIALTLAGLYVFCVFPRHWYLATLFFVGALFCKYTLVAAPAACCLYLALQKEWSKVIRVVASSGAFAILLFAREQRATGGWFAFQMFQTHPDPFSFSHWWSNFIPVPAVRVVLCILAIVLIGENLSRRMLSLPAIYFGLSSLTTLTAGKLGSDSNHFLEWLAALCLTAGLGYDVLRKKASIELAAALASAALAVAVLISLPLELDPEPGLADCPRAYAYARNHPGRNILSENVGAVVAAGKPVIFSNPFIYAFLVKASVLSDVGLGDLVRAHYFDLILLDEDLEDLKEEAANPASPDTIWPPAFVAALEQSYHRTQEFGCRGAKFAYEPEANRSSPSARPSRSR